MNDPINQIVGILNTTSQQMVQDRLAVSSLIDPQVDNKKTSHRYTIENKLIVYEKYDHYGRLISKVPWSPPFFNEKA